MIKFNKTLFIALITLVLSIGCTIECRAHTPNYGEDSNKKEKVVWGTKYDYLSERYINYDDISRYDKGQLRVLRNSIYARHGRYFKDKRLSDYFYTQNWYHPYRKEVPLKELNKYEKANIEFLKKYEK